MVDGALQRDRRGHVAVAARSNTAALLPRAVVHLLGPGRIVAGHGQGAQQAVAQRPGGQGAQLVGERGGTRRVAGLQHPAQRDEQPAAALVAIGTQAGGLDEVAGGALPLLAGGRPAGERLEVVGERTVQGRRRGDPVVQHRDLTLDQRGGGEVQRPAPGRPEGVVDGGAHQRVREGQRPRVRRGLRDQQAAGHGLVDGLHRFADLADARRERQRRAHPQDGGGVDEPAGVVGTRRVAVADQQAERPRRRERPPLVPPPVRNLVEPGDVVETGDLVEHSADVQRVPARAVP